MSEENEIQDNTRSCVRGAFVIAARVTQKKLTGSFAIKLSSIISIQPIDVDDPHHDECLFYTFKDCCYHASIHPYDLIQAINSCVFEPEKHWETYSD